MSDRLARIGMGAIIFVCVAIVLFIANDFSRDRRIEWGPIVTSAAVIASIWAAIFQQARIDHRDQEARHRKSVAARAAMPVSLSEICEYAEGCAAILHRLGSEVRSHGAYKSVFSVPEFPTVAVGTLKECIEHADPSDGAKIASCISTLQVQSSRYQIIYKRKGQPAHMYELASAMNDCVLLHHAASQLFPYARAEGSPEDATVRASAFCCLADDIRFPEAYRLLVERKHIPS